MKEKGFFIQLISDENGMISSKRFAGLLCVFALIIALMANVFSFGKMKPAEFLVDAIAMVAFGALGLTAIEKYIEKYIKNRK